MIIKKTYIGKEFSVYKIGKTWYRIWHQPKRHEYSNDGYEWFLVTENSKEFQDMMKQYGD